MDGTVELLRRIDALEAQLGEVNGKDAIRDCIYRVCRAIDRIDEALLRSAFHSDAKIHFGKIYDGDLEGWIASLIKFQKTQFQTHHLVGNIYINIDGDEAVAESYELARHKSPVDGEYRDLILGMRTLDRFSRRNGEWRISERSKLMDWGRVRSGGEAIYENSPMEKGCRDHSDASYMLFS